MTVGDNPLLHLSIRRYIPYYIGSFCFTKGAGVPGLSSYHSFHLSSCCESLIAFENVEQLRSALNNASRYYLLGEGSNTLFIEDFVGTVLVNKIKGISSTTTETAVYLQVGAGENWHQLVTYALQNGYHGMENLALIPGSVGACPIQNIGAYGIEVADFIESVECVNLATFETQYLSHGECQFGYRDSIFKHSLAGKVVITQVNFKLPRNYTPVTTYGELAALHNPGPQAIYNEVIRVRQKKLPDPAVLGNAGSFFKNPIIGLEQYQLLLNTHPELPAYKVDDESMKVPAAWLIDQLGFKGKTLGGVRCHPTQPLVLTNLGNACGKEVLQMAQQIISAVEQHFGIELEPEVRLIAKHGLITL